jgi:hypothetical protein
MRHVWSQRSLGELLLRMRLEGLLVLHQASRLTAASIPIIQCMFTMKFMMDTCVHGELELLSRYIRSIL